MPAFHDNKLKMVSLDDSGDDSTYSPPRKSAKANKAPPRHKPRPKPKPTPTPSAKPNMGCCLSQPVKRKRTPGHVGHLYDEYQLHSTRPDSGVDGYPLELNFGQSTSSSTVNVPGTYSRTQLANPDASTYVGGSMNTSHGSFFDDRAEWANTDTGVQYLGDQNRRHVGGYDVDLRIPEGYPNSPRNNAFAAQENRELFAHLPGNPFESSDSLNPGDPNYAPDTVINFSRIYRAPANSDPAPDHDNSISGHDNSAAVLHQSVGSTIDQPAVYRVELPSGYETSHLASYTVDRGDVVRIKEEFDDDRPMRGVPTYYSDSEESEFEVRASKIPKINKDGAPRKPRQPRPKLLKWTDNDWKNVALGIVWACGEVGLPIPFDQAAQVVATSCTAGALQQALLKLRDKQLAEGYQIPLLKMAWTRKNKRSNSSTFNADVKPEQDSKSGKTMLPKKTPTRQEGNQVFIVVLKRSYHESDRAHLPKPYVVAVVRGRHRGSGSRLPRTVIAANGSPIRVTEDKGNEDLSAEPMDLSPTPVSDDSGNNAVALNDTSNAGDAPQNGTVGGLLSKTGLNEQAFPLARSSFITPPLPIITTTPEAPPRVRQGLRPNIEAIPFAFAGQNHDSWMGDPMRLTTSPSYDSNFGIFDNAPFMASNSISLAISPSSASMDVMASDFGAGADEGASQLDWPNGIKRDYDAFEDDNLNYSSVGPANGSDNFLNIDGNLPRTPPRSAAAESELSRCMASSNREDGAFNPQGHTSYAHFFEGDLHCSDFWDQVKKGERDNVFGPGN